jgi:hypothetical protein
MKIFKYFTLFVVLISFANCTTRLTDFTIISTKNINIDAKKGNRAEGKDCAYYLFGLLPIFKIAPNLKDAIDNAIESQGEANGLVDGVVYRKFFYFFIISQDCYLVKGNIINK